MAARLPAFELECFGCGHRWMTSARAGMSIRCPQCHHTRRVPKARPRTMAQAAAAPIGADDGETVRLRELWAGELPAAAWRADLEGTAGRNCTECGEQLHWAGAHTVLVCPARHTDGKARKHASPGAVERETRHAQASATPQQRDSGPSPAETEQVGEDVAVALDEIAYVREQLGRIPRGDDWRADAVRALARLGKLEKRYDAARSFADLDAADQAATALIGDDSTRGELDGVLRRVEKLASRQSRQDRGGFLRFTRRGDDEYALEDDDQADDGYPEPLDTAAPEQDGEPGYWQRWDAAATARARAAVASAAAGYTPPDPDWRSKATPAERAYWDQIMGRPAANGARR